jgi:hypothetical protein
VTTAPRSSSGPLQRVQAADSIASDGTVQSDVVERPQVAHVTGNMRNPGNLAVISTTLRASSRLNNSGSARQLLPSRP